MLIYVGVVFIFLAFVSGMLFENGINLRYTPLRSTGNDRVFAGGVFGVGLLVCWLIVTLA